MRRWSLTGIPGPWQRGVSTKVSVQTTHQRLVQVHLTAAIVHLSEIRFLRSQILFDGSVKAVDRSRHLTVTDGLQMRL